MFYLRSTTSYLLLILLITSCISSAFASDSLSYSGRLVNVNGSPVTGPVDLKFEFAYTIPAGTGAVICTEQITNVALTNGVFHTKLDPDCTPSTLTTVLAQTPAGESLAIRVTDETHSKPYSYQALHAMPYANIAKQLSKLGATTGQFLTWDGTQWTPADEQGTGDGTVTSIATGAGLTGGPITTTGTISIADGGVTDVKVATGITRTKLAVGTANYVLVNSGTGAISEVAQLPVLLGGTGSNTAAGARTNLGLGTAAVANIGTAVGAVMGADAVPVCLAFEKLQMTVGPTFSWTCVADADTADATKLPLLGGTMAGTIDMDGNLIVDLATPTAPGHAVNKAYVDARTESQWTTNTTHIFYSTGNVGINQNTPAEKLDVVGNIALTGNLKLQSDTANFVSLKAPAALAGNLILSFPGTAGTSGHALITDGAGNLSWAAVATTGSAVGGDLSGTVATATIVAGAVNSSKIADGSIVDADIAGGAAIAQSKISGLVTELAGKEPTIAGGTALQFWRGDKSWQTLNTAAVPEVTNLYFTEPRVLGTDLLGYVSAAGTITSSDTLLSAIEKLNGNIEANATAATAAFVNVTGDTMSGPLAMGNQNITGLAAPTADDHATTKVYVDSLVSGTSFWLKTVNDLSYVAGKVGIGTATPTERLSVVDNFSTPGLNVFSAQNTNSAGAGQFAIKNNGTGAIAIQASGSAYAGIPALYNKGSVSISGNLTALSFMTNGDLASGGTAPIQFIAGGYAVNPTMTITAGNSGNVGIGTTTPATKLDVNGAAGSGHLFTVTNTNASGGYSGSFNLAAPNLANGEILFFNMGKAASANNRSALTYVHAGDGSTSNRFSLGFYGSDNLVNVLASGNVGIGAIAPTEKLYVSGNIAVTGSARFKSDNANYVELKAPASLAANLTFNLPGTAGSIGNALITDGAGILSWAAVATSSTAVGGDLSGTISNAQIVAGSVGVSEIADTSVTYAKLNLTDGDVPQAKVNGLVTALSGKEPTITAGIAAQYWRGDKTWQTLNSTAVAEGANLYFLDSRVRTALMSTYAVGTAIPLAITDTLIEALGKLEAQIIANDTAFDNTGSWSKNGTDYYYNGGKVGVGLSAPTSKLEVKGEVGTFVFPLRISKGNFADTGGHTSLMGFATEGGWSKGAVGYTRTGSFDTGYLGFYVNNNNASGTDASASDLRMMINGLGNVGIGTTNPLEKLRVAGSAPRFVIDDTDNSAAGVARLGIDVVSNIASFYGLNASNAKHTGVNIMTMDLNSGLVSFSGSNLGVGSKTVYNGNWRVGDNSNNFVIQDTGSSQNVVQVEKNGVADSLYISNVGYVGIGTSTPRAKLDVAAGDAFFDVGHGPIWGANTDGAFIKFRSIGNAAGESYLEIGTIDDGDEPIVFTQSNVEKMRIHTNGFMGVGTNAPSQKLDVSGNVKAVSFISTSDRRLKTNLQKVDGLQTLKQITGYRFDWKKSGETEYGIMAQDVEKVMPEAVLTDKNTGLKSVKYNSLIAPVIEAIKELYAKISGQEKVIKEHARQIASLKVKDREIEDLKKKNEELEKRLNKLENLMTEKVPTKK